jgi:hypothetical protein
VNQRPKSLVEIRKILDRIDLGRVLYDRPRFDLHEKGDGFLLQLVYMEPDADAPVAVDGPVIQKARKWYVSPFSTESEIVRTAYKAVMTSLEHRLGEHFRYRGQKVYSPHFWVGALEKIASDGAFDTRD